MRRCGGGRARPAHDSTRAQRARAPRPSAACCAPVEVPNQNGENPDEPEANERAALPSSAPIPSGAGQG